LRYTAGTVFNSFPWPQDPTAEAVAAVVTAVDALLGFRSGRLLKGISLAEQYNSMQEPGKNRLRELHDDLDRAVRVTYGFDASADPLAQLLGLNHLCAEREAAGLTVRGPRAEGLGNVRRTNEAVTV
jgi:hypothetical protein